MRHPDDYRNEQVVVLGLARSGQAVAKVFASRGAVVTVNDAKTREQCPEADELEAIGVRVVCGGHPPELIHPGVKLIVKNPGIPYSTPPVQRALELGIEIVTEVEVAWHLCPGPIIGITGSNGKTTTATWVGQMLTESGLDPIVAGNIGRPLCDAAEDNKPGQWLVVELSSFQLKGTSRFRPHIACLLNVQPTHLDYHGDMDDYIESKLKLFANQMGDDTVVINMDDEICREASKRVKGRLLPFSSTRKLDDGVYVEEEWIVYRNAQGQLTKIGKIGDIGIPGKHNVENGLAATAIALAAGASMEAIRSSLRSFQGVEHRQEFVKEIDGIRVYNDSKATNPTATIKAFEAFDSPIVWIGGGLDRGIDFAELSPWLESKVKAAVFLGESRFKLEDVARRSGLQSVAVVDTATNAIESLDRAVRLALEYASPGDVVLFSPACASWDMFASFEERGSMFKASAHNL